MPSVKLLSDSNVFKAAIQQAKADAVAQSKQNLPADMNTVVRALPNEANGDQVPSSGLYVSGQGVVKVA